MSYYIIIRGSLGSGKTTISKHLAKQLNTKYIAIDEILDNHNLTEEKEQGYISQKSFVKANEIIAPKILQSLKNEIPVIIDGNFYWKSQIEDLINRLNCNHYIFTLKAPLNICIERDKKRKNSHGKDAAEAVYNKTAEFDYGILIDATKEINECIKEIVSYLSKQK